jgi:hypothetical protein
MPTPSVKVARINKQQLSEIPLEWTNQERGRYLRLLFQLKGIDANRLFRVAYYPYPRCWLLTQEAEAGPIPKTRDRSPAGVADEVFYLQIMGELGWKARAACAALATNSFHFARYGCTYQLPAKPQEVTAADLVHQLGGPLSPPDSPLRFDGEGGWQCGPAKN